MSTRYPFLSVPRLPLQTSIWCTAIPTTLNHAATVPEFVRLHSAAEPALAYAPLVSSIAPAMCPAVHTYAPVRVAEDPPETELVALVTVLESTRLSSNAQYPTRLLVDPPPPTPFVTVNVATLLVMIPHELLKMQRANKLLSPAIVLLIHNDDVDAPAQWFPFDTSTLFVCQR